MLVHLVSLVIQKLHALEMSASIIVSVLTLNLAKMENVSTLVDTLPNVVAKTLNVLLIITSPNVHVLQTIMEMPTAIVCQNPVKITVKSFWVKFFILFYLVLDYKPDVLDCTSDHDCDDRDYCKDSQCKSACDQCLGVGYCLVASYHRGVCEPPVPSQHGK